MASQNEEEEQEDKHIGDIQKTAHEFKEMLIQVLDCDATNVIHSAKRHRLGESHAAKAK